MRLNIQHLNIRSHDALDAWVEEQIFALGRVRQIDEANVRLVHLVSESPAYQVHVHLVTPGPDISAESRDHTPQAAFTKAMTQLREQITPSTTKRLQRLKTANSSGLKPREPKQFQATRK
jgi:ribosome-associated translation inhibitor RaiA